MLLSSLTPPQLFRLYESGQIERTQLHEAMASHARRLIGEMEEEYRNPIAATLERMRNRLAAARLGTAPWRTSPAGSPLRAGGGAGFSSGVAALECPSS
ncbi:MAG: hypothetical protein R3F31_09750 [Verrucomicrobiales bacterium]